MTKKKNGVHVEVLKADPVVEAHRSKKATTQPSNKSRRSHPTGYARAYEAVDRAFKKTEGFDGLSPFHIALIINGALRDEFIPLGKMKVKKQKGDHLTQAIRMASKETLNLAEATPQGQA